MGYIFWFQRVGLNYRSLVQRACFASNYHQITERPPTLYGLGSWFGLVRFGSPYGITWVKISIWELLFNTIQQNLLRWVRSQHRNEYNFECDTKKNIKIRPLDSTLRIPSKNNIFNSGHVFILLKYRSLETSERERITFRLGRTACSEFSGVSQVAKQTNNDTLGRSEVERGGQRRAQHFNRIHNILLRAQFRNLSSYLVSLRKLLFFQTALYG